MITGSILGLPAVGMLLMSMPCISLGNEPQSSKNKRTILGGVLILIVGKRLNFIRTMQLQWNSGQRLNVMVRQNIHINIHIKVSQSSSNCFALTCKHQDPLQPSSPWPLLTPPQMLTSCWEQRMLNMTVFLPRVHTYAHTHANAHLYMFLFHWTLPPGSHHIPLLHLLSSTPCLCPETHGNLLPELPSLLCL